MYPTPNCNVRKTALYTDRISLVLTVFLSNTCSSQETFVGEEIGGFATDEIYGSKNPLVLKSMYRLLKDTVLILFN